MAVVTDISICADALIRLGAGPISNFTASDDRTVQCARIYPRQKAFLMSIYDWRFIVKKRQLARLEETPNSEFSYYYQLPSDRLTDGVIAMFEDDGQGVPPSTDFRLYAGGRIASNAQTVFIDYAANNIMESAWPPYFVELVTKAMMCELAIPITDNGTLRDMLVKETFGNPAEYPNGGLVRMCRQRNSAEDPPVPIASYTLIDARFGGV